MSSYKDNLVTSNINGQSVRSTRCRRTEMWDVEKDMLADGYVLHSFEIDLQLYPNFTGDPFVPTKLPGEYAIMWFVK